MLKIELLGQHHARVLMPFLSGYGRTMGVALRRVLLSSMMGYAPTEVTIAGVLHEYSTIDGVQEDVVHVMLNLKGVVFKLHNRDEVTLVLRKEGEGPVRASDIQMPHDVEVINPDHVIANLSHGGKLEMQIKVEKGRGYFQCNAQRGADSRTIGRLVLDAAFSPVRQVRFDVNEGLETDELIIEITTSGSVSPEDAVRASAKILVEQLLVFMGLGLDGSAPSTQPQRAPESLPPAHTPLDVLDISDRTQTLLAAAGVTTVEQLRGLSQQALLRTPSLGRKAAAELQQALLQL
jgi:DNA-directed RNA polymerase subunit alpha